MNGCPDCPSLQHALDTALVEVTRLTARLRQTEAGRDEARAMVCEAYSKTANYLRWARPHPMQFNIANGSLLRSIDAIFSQQKS